MKLLCLLLVGLSLPVMAAPNYTLLNGVIGTHALLKWDGGYYEGTATVVASDAGIGFQTAPLAMGSDPVPAYSLVTSSAITTLTSSGNIVTQTATVGADDIKITYEVDDGYYTITAQDCTSANCRETQVIATTGKAPGDVVAATPFLNSLSGTYTISLSGGAAPPAGDNQGDVDTTSEPTEASFYFSYCTPTGCDLGYTGFPYATTNIFHENLGTGHDIYTMFKNSSTNQLEYYDWEVNNGKITFRNHQYTLNGNTVCLEHVVTKSPADCGPGDGGLR